ncbi:MAG: hypothetical protein ACK5WS_00170 [Alphaproteobacteria bacterium]|jgi:hypothetical protein|nr:hypothetical protein [Candidatus Jidaibacter sp.]
MKGGNGDDKINNGSIEDSSIWANQDAIKQSLERHLKDTRVTLEYDSELKYHAQKKSWRIRRACCKR